MITAAISFITERRLFSKQLKPTMYSAYFLDFLSLTEIWLAVVYSVPVSRGFVVEDEQVIAPPSAVAGIGFVFTYGIRISMTVAMLRKDRAPQVIEWWCMLIGLIVPLSVYPLDDVLLRLYAHVSGYALCHTVATKPLVEELFVLRGHACPAP